MARTHEILEGESIEAPSQNGVVSEPPRAFIGTRDAVLNIIRAMYEGENGPNDGVGTYSWRRDLQSEISRSFFRRFGVLADLNIHYGGDIPLAVRDAFPNPIGKPLLLLDEFRPNDSLHMEWRQREEGIDSRIAETTTTRKPEFIPYFRERKIRHGGKWVKIYIGQHQERIPSGFWWERENSDLKSVVKSLIRPGDTALSFLSGHDANFPSMILSSTKSDGKLFIVTPGSYLEQGLFSSFLQLVVDLERVKGVIGKEEKTDQQRKAEREENRYTGVRYISHALRSEMGEFLSHPYRYNERFYREGLDWRRTILPKSFFERFRIHPLTMGGLGLPSGIVSGSLNAVVEADRLNQVPEENLEETLYELDRVLRPGGYLIFREGARQQALLEYYGQELFAQHFTRLDMTGINSNQIVVLQKECGEEPPVIKGMQFKGNGRRRQSPREEIQRLKAKYAFQWVIEEGNESINVGTISHIQQVLRDMEPVQLERMRMTKLEATSVSIWLNQINEGELEQGKYVEEEGAFHGWRRIPRGKQWELLFQKKEDNHILFHLRRLPEGELNPEARVGKQKERTLSDRERLIAEVAKAINQSKDSTNLSLSWFRSKGFLPILIAEFGGNIERVLEASRLEVMRKEHHSKTSESTKPIKPPQKSKAFYTVRDMSKDIGAPVAEIRDILKSLGYRQAKNAWIIGPSHYTSEKVVPYHFTYAEYQTMKEIVVPRIKKAPDSEMAGKPDAVTETDEVLEILEDEDSSKLPETGVSLPPIPKDVKLRYTLEDLVQSVGASKNQIRKGLSSIGVKRSGKLRLSYQEFMVTTDALKRQNLNNRGQ